MSNESQTIPLSLAEIKVDKACQARVGNDESVIDEYAQTMKERGYDRFPAVVVFYDGEHYWLSDGFHRHAAAEKAGLSSVNARIRQGSQRDAVLYAVGSNTSHGLRRTNADKRRAVSILLDDAEWCHWGNREIARRCGVDEWLVRKLRDEQGPPSVSAGKPQMARKVERDGKTYQMDVTKIGKRDVAPDPCPSPPDLSEPERVWDHARLPESGAELQELLSVWSRTSEEVRREFLISIGVSVLPEPEAGADAKPECPPETESAGEVELSDATGCDTAAAPQVVEVCTAEPEENQLFEMWKDLKRNTRADGRRWVADNCPSVYHDSHFRVTDSLVPFRQAAREATSPQIAEFLLLAEAYQAEHRYD